MRWALLSLVLLGAACAPTLPREAELPAFHVPDEDPSLPSALELNRRHAERAGLAELLERHDSIHVSGRARVPSMDLEGEFDAWRARPARSAVRIWLPSMGEILYGCDGERAWSVHPVVGPRLLEGATLAKARSGAVWDQLLRRPEGLERFVTVAREPFAGRDCFVVFGLAADPPDAPERERAFREFYAVDSGLLAGLQEPAETSDGVVDLVRVFDDYRPVEGLPSVLVARRTVQRSGGLELVLEVDAIELDRVDDEAFAPPPEIETLLAP